MLWIYMEYAYNRVYSMFFKGYDARVNAWLVELVAFSAAYGYICLILPPR